MKKCATCGCVKEDDEYFKRSSSSDGLQRSCKACTKVYYAEYRKRPHAKEAKIISAASYCKSEKGRASQRAAEKVNTQRYPEKVSARRALRYAVKKGKIARLPCWVCGETEVEGHHPTYSMKLDVVWLCKKHHDEIHHEYI